MVTPKVRPPEGFEQDFILTHDFSQKKRKVLMNNGAPFTAFLRKNQNINLDESVTAIQCEIPGVNVRKLSVNKQLKKFEGIWDNPLWGSYVLVISSYPTDIYAKQVALSLMERATSHFYQKKKQNTTLLRRRPPMWHTVYGGFKDAILDNEMFQPPAMLIVSNVLDDCSNLKLEKLRDIINKFERIPIVIVTAASDPYSFMFKNVKLPLGGALYIGPPDKDVLV